MKWSDSTFISCTFTMEREKGERRERERERKKRRENEIKKGRFFAWSINSGKRRENK